MTPRKFFVGRAIGFLILIVVGLAYFIYTDYFSAPATLNENEGEGNVSDANPVVFAWKFEEADSLNLDGAPNTNIFLAITYSNDAVENKLIDTTPGSCNELPDTEEEIVTNSTMIQCYSAGLGHRYKITRDVDSYLVERKTFEEALPNHTPPLYEYEVIAEFPRTY